MKTRKETMDYETVVSFWKASAKLKSVYSTLPKLCHLSGSEYWSLFLIYEGFATQSKISEHFSYSRQTLNSAFKQLQQRGYIRLVPCEDSLRSKQAILTAKGKQLVDEQIMPVHLIEEKAWERMSEEERELLIKLMLKFGRTIYEGLETLKADIDSYSSQSTTTGKQAWRIYVKTD